MNDEELVAHWKMGYKWLTDHEQISGTNKNRLGEPYNHTSYLVALKRIELLEDQMRERSIQYGQN